MGADERAKIAVSEFHRMDFHSKITIVNYYSCLYLDEVLNSSLVCLSGRQHMTWCWHFKVDLGLATIIVKRKIVSLFFFGFYFSLCFRFYTFYSNGSLYFLPLFSCIFMMYLLFRHVSIFVIISLCINLIFRSLLSYMFLIYHGAFIVILSVFFCILCYVY